MSLRDFFRKEAVDNQRTRLWGDVILVQPVSYFLISAVFAGIMIAAGIFLTNQNYARKESVTGYLVPDAGVVRIYADQGGLLERLYIKAGQSVKKGDAVALVKLERLSTTGENAQEEVLSSVNRELAGLLLRIDALFKQERQEQTDLADRISGLTTERTLLNEEHALLDEGVALASKQYEAALELAKKGYAAERLVDSRHQALINAKQARTSSKRQILTTSNAIKGAENAQNLLPFRFADLRANLTARKENLLQQVANLEQVQGYTITAPVDGVLSSVQASEGASLRPGLPIMAIRPSGTQLIAQLLVPSRAIGLIELGQEAKIQYDAFPYQRFGIFTGTVQAVSASILTPADLPTPIPMQEAFYVVQVVLDHQNVEVKGRPVALKAGMVLKADITLENRTLIEWVLDPLFSITGKI